MSRITRKELKTDRFALEVGHTVDFFDRHRREVLIYGAAALVVVLLVVGFYFYRQRQHAARGRAGRVRCGPVVRDPRSQGRGSRQTLRRDRRQIRRHQPGNHRGVHPGRHGR